MPQPSAAPLAPPRFDEAYRASFDAVWRTLSRLGVRTEQLEDAAQEVFLIVHRRLGRFAGRSALKTWVIGIAVKVAKDFRRAHLRRPESEALAVSLPDSRPSPFELTHTAQALELVARLLNQLDDDHRDVLVLFELEQMTAPEIGEALELNLNTVYSRLRLARQAFDAALHRLKGATP